MAAIDQKPSALSVFSKGLLIENARCWACAPLSP